MVIAGSDGDEQGVAFLWIGEGLHDVASLRRDKGGALVARLWALCNTGGVRVGPEIGGG